MEQGDGDFPSYDLLEVARELELVLSADASLNWYEVRTILRETADQIDLANTDPVGKWYDKDKTGSKNFSQWYGYGRINVDRAVEYAIDHKTTSGKGAGVLTGATD